MSSACLCHVSRQLVPACLLIPLRPTNARTLQEGLFAWSGSDSDDGMGLVGIAVDGAISGEITEEEQEEERPR